MNGTRHLSVDEVVWLHEKVMTRTGFAPSPLRDRGGLESAIARSRNAEYYDDAGLIRQAALLAVGISQKQAFLDGNKRTAYAATEVFFYYNNLNFHGDRMEFARWLEYIAEQSSYLHLVTDDFERWLDEQVY